jgi:superfamily II DNA or RNA helicase
MADNNNVAQRILSNLRWTNTVNEAQDGYVKICKALLSDTDYEATKTYITNCRNPIYYITKNNVNGYSTYKWYISYNYKLEGSELSNYVKSLNNKNKALEIKKKSKEEDNINSLAKMEALKEEFKAWYDKINKNFYNVESAYKVTMKDYLGKIYETYKIPIQIESKLLKFQVNGVKQIINTIRTNKRVILGSDTGTGKSYMIIAACKVLGLNVCIVSPRPIIDSWSKICTYFEVVNDIYTYETFKTGKTPYVSKLVDTFNSNNESDLMEKMKKMSLSGVKPNIYKSSKDKKNHSQESNIIGYYYNPIYVSNTCFIFDEAHLCKKNGTLNSMMFNQLKKQDVMGAALSATIIDSDDYIDNICGFLNVDNDIQKTYNKSLEEWYQLYLNNLIMPLDFSSIYKMYKNEQFIKNYVEEVKVGANKRLLHKDVRPLKYLHKLVFPLKGNRISIKDLGDEFPDNLLMANAYDMKDVAGEIDQEYKIVKEALASMKDETIEQRRFNELLIKYQNKVNNKDELEELKSLSSKKEFDLDNYNLLYQHDQKSVAQHPFVAILRARQRIEILKINSIRDLIVQYIYEGKSIVIFVEYRETLRSLYEKLNGVKYNVDDEDVIPRVSMLHGDLSDNEIEVQKERFQNNTNNVMLATIGTGGVGISLHDIHGGHPRVSIFVTVPNKAIAFKQALGRIHRAGGKSKCLQLMIYCRNTIEEKLCLRLKEKLDSIDMINDGDMNHDLILNN